jgi:hypothetical protein
MTGQSSQLPGVEGFTMRLPSVAVAALAVLLVLPLGAVAAEPGDEPATALPASVGTEQYDSTDMTESAEDPTSCADPEFDGGFTNTMWFSYVPDRDQLTLIDVNSFVSSDGSTDYLAGLFVYAQTDGGLDLVGCNAFPATVLFPAESATTYLIMVGGLTLDGFPDDDPALLDRGGTFDLTIEPIRGRILRDHFHDSDTFIDPFLTEECGDGDVTVSFNDRGTAKTFFTATEPRAFTFQISGTTTFQMDGGPIVKVTYHETFHDYFDGTASEVGVPIKVAVDGNLLVLDAGKLIFGPDGELTFEAGPHPIFHEGFDLCALLRGD